MSTCDMSLFNHMYGWGYIGGMGNQILRNMNSSLRLTRMICCLADSGSCLEWYSELPCDVSVPDLYSNDSSEFSSGDDMTSSSGFRNVGRCQLLVCTPEFCSS